MRTFGGGKEKKIATSQILSIHKMNKNTTSQDWWADSPDLPPLHKYTVSWHDSHTTFFFLAITLPEETASKVVSPCFFVVSIVKVMHICWNAKNVNLGGEWRSPLPVPPQHAVTLPGDLSWWQCSMFVDSRTLRPPPCPPRLGLNKVRRACDCHVHLIPQLLHAKPAAFCWLAGNNAKMPVSGLTSYQISVSTFDKLWVTVNLAKSFHWC